MHLYTSCNKISSLLTTNSNENPEISESNPQAYQTVEIPSHNNTEDLSPPHSQDIYITLITSLLIGSSFSISCLKNSIPSSPPPVTYLGTHYILFSASFILDTSRLLTIKQTQQQILKIMNVLYPPKANNGTGNWDIKDCTSVSVRKKLNQNLNWTKSK